MPASLTEEELVNLEIAFKHLALGGELVAACHAITGRWGIARVVNGELGDSHRRDMTEGACVLLNALPALLASARAVRNVERVERRLRIGLAGGVVMNTELLLSLLRGHAEELRAALTATTEPTAGEER